MYTVVFIYFNRLPTVMRKIGCCRGSSGKTSKPQFLDNNICYLSICFSSPEPLGSSVSLKYRQTSLYIRCPATILHRYGGCIMIIRWCLLPASTLSHLVWGVLVCVLNISEFSMFKRLTSSHLWFAYFDNLDFRTACQKLWDH